MILFYRITTYETSHYKKIGKKGGKKLRGAYVTEKFPHIKIIPVKAVYVTYHCAFLIFRQMIAIKITKQPPIKWHAFSSPPPIMEVNF